MATYTNEKDVLENNGNSTGYPFIAFTHFNPCYIECYNDHYILQKLAPYHRVPIKFNTKKQITNGKGADASTFGTVDQT